MKKKKKGQAHVKVEKRCESYFGKSRCKNAAMKHSIFCKSCKDEKLARLQHNTEMLKLSNVAKPKETIQEIATQIYDALFMMDKKRVTKTYLFTRLAEKQFQRRFNYHDVERVIRYLINKGVEIVD